MYGLREIVRASGFAVRQKAQSGGQARELENQSVFTCALDMAVIVPTFDDREVVASVAAHLSDILSPLNFEIIFVDNNSSDGTPHMIRALAAENPNIRCVQNYPETGLADVVVKGVQVTSAPLIAVVACRAPDDHVLLPSMLEKLYAERLDLVVGARARAVDEQNWQDSAVSELAAMAADKLGGTALLDPLSSFFVIRADHLRDRLSELAGGTSSVLLDILLAKGPRLSSSDIDLEHGGDTEQTVGRPENVAMSIVELMISYGVKGTIPAKLIVSAFVGILAFIIHAVLFTMFNLGGFLSPLIASSIALFLSIMAAFYLNNVLTFHSRRLSGRNLLSGAVIFVFAALIGIAAYLGCAAYLAETFGLNQVVSSVIGWIVGVTWIFSVTARYCWKPERNQIRMWD